ncbi:hypothetical protein KP758_11380 [Streptococcus equi subsp. equi]|nr:hypothetical protein [Streptococcus equi]MCD3516257.1 hypothetical protein [Streptococcus equi subsp. equi]
MLFELCFVPQPVFSQLFSTAFSALPRAENAVLKKLREYRLRDEAKLKEQQKSSKN